jgi:hypothetical protein
MRMYLKRGTVNSEDGSSMGLVITVLDGRAQLMSLPCGSGLGKLLQSSVIQLHVALKDLRAEHQGHSIIRRLLIRST